MKNKIREKIVKAFPVIKEIKDSDLREKVLKAWSRGLKEGSFRTLEEIPFSIDIPGAKLLNHINWVMEVSSTIADLVERRMKIPVNRDLLIASVLLHDLSKAFEYEKKGKRSVKSKIGKKFMHGFWGTYVALEEGVSQDLAHIISTHSKDSPTHPELLEGIILHYADFAHADLLHFQRGMKLYLSL